MSLVVIVTVIMKSLTYTQAEVESELFSTAEKLSQNGLLKALKCVHYAHILLGFRFKRCRNSNTNPKQLVRMTTKCSFFMMTILSWANVFRFFIAYTLDVVWGPDLADKFLYHITLLIQASGSVFALLLSLKTDKFFADWWDYKIKFGTDRNDCMKRLARNAKVSIIVTLAMIAAIQTLYIYQYMLINGSFVEYQFIGLIAETTVQEKHPILIIALLCSGIFLAGWLFPISYMAIICLGLRDEFLIQRREFEQEFKKHNQFVGDLEKHRKRHSDIACLVKQWDCICSVYILVLFVLNIPFCCFLVYTIVYISWDWHQVAFVWCPGMLCSLTSMFIITAIGSLLHMSVSFTRWSGQEITHDYMYFLEYF